MATTKLIEIRDRMTFLPALAVRLDPSCEADRYLAARAGFGTRPEQQREYIILTKLVGNMATSDPHDWNDRTMNVAHCYLLEHFAEVPDGGVVDVEFILGETAAPAASERDS